MKSKLLDWERMGMGDRADFVENNREKIRRKMGSLVFTNQVHGDFVRVVTEENPSDLPAGFVEKMMGKAIFGNSFIVRPDFHSKRIEMSII